MTVTTRATTSATAPATRRPTPARRAPTPGRWARRGVHDTLVMAQRNLRVLVRKPP